MPGMLKRKIDAGELRSPRYLSQRQGHAPVSVRVRRGWWNSCWVEALLSKDCKVRGQVYVQLQRLPFTARRDKLDSHLSI
jgi:hypothetical protein